MKEGRKCFIYLCTPHTLFIVIRHQTYQISDHSNNERKPAAAISWVLFPININRSCTCTILHTGQYTAHPLLHHCGELVGTGNISMGPPSGIYLMMYCTKCRHSTTELRPTPQNVINVILSYKLGHLLNIPLLLLGISYFHFQIWSLKSAKQLML